MHGVPSFSDIF